MENEKVAAAAELALKRINELEAENDRLRAQLAEAEADKLAAVRRAIEAAAGCALTWGMQARVRALSADEIANPPEKNK